jgi:adenylate cyclase
MRVSPIQQSSSALERAVRTVLVVDVVDSVRLMEDNEDDTIARWRALAGQIERDILPLHNGRLVKSLGDGMLVDFPHVPPAITAAFAIQSAGAAANQGMESSRQMLLRIGMQVGELIADDHDVYGRGVNLAARLTTIAGPGEIVVSAGVRDHLTPVLDADIEDLGDCYLKNVRQPVRAYRLGPPGPRPIIDSDSTAGLRPTIAVIAFRGRKVGLEHHVLGDILADELIGKLSRTPDLNVISRLSTMAFRDRNVGTAEVSAMLGAGYVLSGSYRIAGKNLTVVAELSEAKTGRVIWGDDLKADVEAIIHGNDPLVEQVVSRVSVAVIVRELERAQSQALPTLESYTLLMAAISLMHRLSGHDFVRARELLRTLVERAPRRAIPQAWLAKWHVLRVWQGWSDDEARDTQIALDCTKRALDADGHCSLALAIDGFVHANLLRQLDVALERYELALQVNPNDALAWLLKGTAQAFRGEGAVAMKDTQRALKLSPLDPHRYFYDSLAATAALSAFRYERAVELAQRSLRANRTHASTLRALVVARWELGQHDEARKMVGELMKVAPTFGVARFLERHPSSGYPIGKIWADALRQAGVPD